MPRFTLKRLFVCISLILVAVALGEFQFRLFQNHYRHPLVLSFLWVLSSGLFLSSLILLDRRTTSWTWFIFVFALYATFSMFGIWRLQFAN